MKYNLHIINSSWKYGCFCFTNPDYQTNCTAEIVDIREFHYNLHLKVVRKLYKIFKNQEEAWMNNNFKNASFKIYEV